jgi:hypothetical protein
MRDISVLECKRIWGVGGDFEFRNWILNLLIRLNTIVPDSTDEGNQEWTSGVYILHHVHINLAEKAKYSPVIPRVWGANIELMVAGIQPL